MPRALHPRAPRRPHSTGPSPRHGALVGLAALAAATTLAAAPAAGQTTATSPGGADGGAMRQERALPLSLAAEIARLAVEACAAGGAAVAATVVDRSGVPRAMLRADGAGPHTAEESRAKAYTALSLRNGTAALAAALDDGNAARRRAARALSGLPGFLLHGGGVPIVAAEEVVGGLGVGGAETGEADEACAEAALARVRERLL